MVKAKRICLFKEWLTDAGYKDMAVVDLLITGVQVVGEAPRSGIWRPRSSTIRCTREVLWATARQTREAILTPRGPDPLPGMDAAL